MTPMTPTTATERFVIRTVRDGRMLAPGSKLTCLPEHAIRFDQDEIIEWLELWGKGYEAVPESEAKEVYEY